MLTSGVSAWQRRSLLLKLSGQTELLEELAEISVDRLGTITSAADGECTQGASGPCPVERFSASAALSQFSRTWRSARG